MTSRDGSVRRNIQEKEKTLQNGRAVVESMKVLSEKNGVILSQDMTQSSAIIGSLSANYSNGPLESTTNMRDTVLYSDQCIEMLDA